jgi:hypothetical protein
MKIFKVVINETFEEEKALIEVSDDNAVIFKGDYYHDKIDKRIDGFFDGLSYCEVKYELQEDEYINPKNDLFDKLDFYNDKY